MKRTLIVMVKEPRPGRVKTRLGRDIGVSVHVGRGAHAATAGGDDDYQLDHVPGA